MEMKIEEKLYERYRNIDIDVEYLDLRLYKINVKIKVKEEIFEKEIFYTWDAYYTNDVNINTISNKIDNYILKIYRNEVRYYE